MAAAQFTPGPIYHFAILRSAPTTPRYLGTCVLAPEPEGEKFKLPVMNDLAGRSVPFQLVQDGEMWYVTTTLNRFDLPLLRDIRALESGGAGLGSESGSARGTLSIGVTDWSLILLNGYATTVAAGLPTATAAANLEVGKQWFTTNIRKYKESTVGTRVKEVAMAVECQNIFIPATRGFRCYTESASEINFAQLMALVN